MPSLPEPVDLVQLAGELLADLRASANSDDAAAAGEYGESIDEGEAFCG